MNVYFPSNKVSFFVKYIKKRHSKINAIRNKGKLDNYKMLVPTSLLNEYSLFPGLVFLSKT